MRWGRLSPCVGVALCIAVCAPGPALGGSALDQAKAHNSRAAKLFHLGLFRQAATHYRKAYKARPVPDLLYNLAQCHKRLAGLTDQKRALFYFRSYLRRAPFSPIRASVQRDIARTERKVARLELAQRSDRRATRPVYKRWWFWTVIGAAVVGTAVTATTVALTQREEATRGTLPPGIFALPLRQP